MKKIKAIRQQEAVDCGPTCLKMVAQYYGKTVSLRYLRDKCEITREGVSMQGINNAAEMIGFRTIGVKITTNELNNGAPLPCILHWNQSHFVVLYEIKNKKYKLADPAHGLTAFSEEEFKKSWCSTNGDQGITLLLEPSPSFYNTETEEEDPPKRGFTFLFGYLRGYKAYVIQIMIGLLAVSILQLIFPFLTQSVVDKGIRFKDLNFIWIILIAQISLLIGQTTIEFIRSWILLHISARINIALISDFLSKLIRLPHSYFERKMTGDILQRIGDHNRIQSFITQNSLMTIFSILNFVVFSIVLSLYSSLLLSVFLIFTTIYILWVVFFLKIRKELDYKRFNAASQNQNKMLEIIYGIHEIKLYNAESYRRWEWERQQAKLFYIGLSGMRVQQLQDGGAFAINSFKNTIIAFFAAKAVVDGQISLGMMMAVQYIIGQMNAPIIQLINFIRATQDAKISLDRISEVYNEKDEQQLNLESETTLPLQRDIELKNVFFKYPGMHDSWVLDDVSLKIPQGKITAIVGSSGSGKTTLLKLLLKYQNAQKGKIEIDHIDLQQIHPTTWRSSIGAVMQDGYIFGDTIAGNIIVDGSTVDKQKLRQATEIAQIRDFIESLSLGYNTKIGNEGINVSMGQKQRLLIARAIYKNPDVILFDEATNSLDAVNERKIVEGLNLFFKNKTVVIVAHRLSTVKHADNIVVLDKGKIVEQGTHEKLTSLRGYYYTLVKNQLELGN